MTCALHVQIRAEWQPHKIDIPCKCVTICWMSVCRCQMHFVPSADLLQIKFGTCECPATYSHLRVERAPLNCLFHLRQHLLSKTQKSTNHLQSFLGTVEISVGCCEPWAHQLKREYTTVCHVGNISLALHAAVLLSLSSDRQLAQFVCCKLTRLVEGIYQEDTGSAPTKNAVSHFKLMKLTCAVSL